MSIKVDHIAVAVKDIKSALILYQDLLGLKVTGEERVDSQGVNVVFLEGDDGSKVELISPLKKEGSIYKFLENRGEGLHHLALQVDNLEEIVDFLTKKGIKFAVKMALGARNKKIAFIHPQSANGVLIELLER